jgi:dolichol-phosphate hexosyltransferase
MIYNHYMNYGLSDVSLVILTMNEEECIQFVLDEIKEMGFGEVIIIDNNSSDKTIEFASKYDVKVVTQSKPGWGNAVIQGFSLATKEFITYMDGDGSYNPISIIEMKKIIQKGSAVFGSRYKGGTKSEDDTLIRLIGNKIYTSITKQLFHFPTTDSLFFFPLIYRSDFEEINTISSDFTMCIEIPFLCTKKGLDFIEISSIERKRYAGKSKVNALTDGFNILLGMSKLHRQHRLYDK